MHGSDSDITIATWDCSAYAIRRGDRAARRSNGFTLIEVLVAISILTVITAIVYESFAAVTEATARARVSAEEMRLRQYLVRSFQSNLAAVYVDPPYLNEQFQFVGTDGSGAGGAEDSIEFCSSAPLIGGTSPPGILKRAQYAVVSGEASRLNLDSGITDDSDARSQQLLEASETPLVESVPELDPNAVAQNPGALRSRSANTEISRELADTISEIGIESPSWSVPISSLDIAYFDGTDWVDEWDSMALGRLPWSVRIRINFALSSDEKEAGGAGFGDNESADLEMIIPLAPGLSVLTDPTMWQQSLFAGMDVFGTQPPISGSTNTALQPATQRNATGSGAGKKPT